MPRISQKYETTKIIEIYTDGIDGDVSTKTFTVALKLPFNLFSTNTKYCYIVQISYELEITAETSGFHNNIQFRIPITIGGVALRLPSSMASHQEDLYLPVDALLPMVASLPHASAPDADSRMFHIAIESS